MTTSPSDLLPIELIQIFISCLPENNRTFLPPKKNYVVQLVISQVSSIWRLIALDTLQLWDNFILSVDDDGQQAESALRLASLWFHRAGSLPITLKVWTDLPQDNPHIQDLYRLISSHCTDSRVWLATSSYIVSRYTTNPAKNRLLPLTASLWTSQKNSQSIFLSLRMAKIAVSYQACEAYI